LYAILPERLLELAKRMTGKGPNLQIRLFQSLSTAARRRIAEMPEPAVGLTLTPDARENRWRLLTNPHVFERTEIWAQVGASHGIAFAFPLLDRRVVEFAASLPSEFFVRDGFRRRPFRDAMSGILPDRIRLRHQKYQPFPGRLLDLAESKDELLARIDAYSKNENICRLIDIAQLRREVEGFPTPERLREQMRGGDNPTPEPGMIVAVRMLMAAEYLAQHGGK
jgi:asparagine synthase (glutamine-hydrolysing)